MACIFLHTTAIPLQVDVTTQDPGNAYLALNGIRVCIGGSWSDWCVRVKHAQQMLGQQLNRFCCRVMSMLTLTASVFSWYFCRYGTSAGGVAYVGVFASYNAYYSPAFIFPVNLGNNYAK